MHISPGHPQTRLDPSKRVERKHKLPMKSNKRRAAATVGKGQEHLDASEPRKASGILSCCRKRREEKPSGGNLAVSATSTTEHQARAVEAYYEIKKPTVESSQSLPGCFLGSGH